MNCWKGDYPNQHLIHHNDVKFNDYLQVRVHHKCDGCVEHNEGEEPE